MLYIYNLAAHFPAFLQSSEPRFLHLLGVKDAWECNCAAGYEQRSYISSSFHLQTLECLNDTCDVDGLSTSACQAIIVLKATAETRCSSRFFYKYGHSQLQQTFAQISVCIRRAYSQILGCRRRQIVGPSTCRSLECSRCRTCSPDDLRGRANVTSIQALRPCIFLAQRPPTLAELIHNALGAFRYEASEKMHSVSCISTSMGGRVFATMQCNYRLALRAGPHGRRAASITTQGKHVNLHHGSQQRHSCVVDNLDYGRVHVIDLPY